MADPEQRGHGKNKSAQHLTKKCPECYTYLPLHARVCPACHAKVGEVDRLGFAEKPVDWLGYLLAVVSIVGFAIFMWWAFFRE